MTHPVPLRIQLLGAVRIEVGNAPIEVDTRKAVALLTYLAVEGQPQSRDALAALLWPEYEETRARSSLRRTLSVLRKALGGDWLHVDRGTVDLASDRIEVDVVHFRTLLEERSAHGHALSEVCDACLAPLTRAAAVVRGQFMDGFWLRDSPAFDEWQHLQRERLREELATVLVRLIHLHTQRSEFDAAIACARRWLALDPLLEAAHRALMSLYAVSGDRVSAVRQYRECARILSDELGVAPLKQTTALYERIVEHDLPVPPSFPIPQPAPPDHESLPEPSLHSEHVPLPFAGRAEELARLRQCVEMARGHLIAVEGEAGVGKSRLVEELLRERAGDRVLLARCYEGESRLAYAPVTALLHELVSAPEARERLATLPPPMLADAARLLPEIGTLCSDIPRPTAPGEPGAQIRFFESITRLITLGRLPGQGTLVVIEDAHWADDASADLLAFLVRRMRGEPITVILTWRREEMPAAHRLRRLLVECQREGHATQIALERLGEHHLQELLAARFPGPPRPEISQRLYRETEGLPLFVDQYLASRPSLGSVLDEGGDDVAEEWPLPEGLRDLLRIRIRAVSEAGWQLLTSAAVIGRECSLDLLREVSGRSEEEAVATLEEVLAHGLLRQVSHETSGEAAYDFSHSRLRTVAYEEMSAARRRLLHRRVAEALEHHASSGRAPSDLDGQLARHFGLAGDTRRAGEHFRRAGDHARALYANTEALSHYQEALALGHPETATLHRAIGDLLTLAGEYRRALESYEAAAAFADPGELPGLEQTIGNLYRRIGQWSLADGYYRSAADALRARGDVVELTGVYVDWSLNSHHQAQADAALRLASEAMDLVQSTTDPMAQAQVHNVFGILARSRGETAAAQEHLRTSLRLAEAVGDPTPCIAALNNLALATFSAGDAVEAEALVRQALDLCRKLGDRHKEAALHSNLADILRTAGDSEHSMDHLKLAAGLFAEVGRDLEAWQPEIWKLTEW